MRGIARRLDRNLAEIETFGKIAFGRERGKRFGHDSLEMGKQIHD